ncbi:hypothetical protein K461DRAFT_148712 [Myriangium duriaei CBS 260.36]|uniref:Uncharacterized protein n=1 Tax=Myriangium duriaei CBS 260.36 TaxID=1168546 RepID=A0A9P4J314_9PEZI|nr:hypothetical protein K461DRAFT_148712 [Myriangium duriaei CBS 260.36]
MRLRCISIPISAPCMASPDSSSPDPHSLSIRSSVQFLLLPPHSERGPPHHPHQYLSSFICPAQSYCLCVLHPLSPSPDGQIITTTSRRPRAYLAGQKRAITSRIRCSPTRDHSARTLPRIDPPIRHQRRLIRRNTLVPYS